MRIIFLAVLLLSSPHLLAHGTIMIEGVENSEGFIDVKIYENEDSFLKEEMASEVISKKATQGKTVISLSKIHEGQIAIVIYHDEDSNGKLKTGFFWRPKEGFAFSNNYSPKGPPKFSKAVVNFVHGEPIYIRLNY